MRQVTYLLFLIILTGCITSEKQRMVLNPIQYSYLGPTAGLVAEPIIINKDSVFIRTQLSILLNSLIQNMENRTQKGVAVEYVFRDKKRKTNELRFNRLFSFENTLPDDIVQIDTLVQVKSGVEYRITCNLIDEYSSGQSSIQTYLYVPDFSKNDVSSITIAKPSSDYKHDLYPTYDIRKTDNTLIFYFYITSKNKSNLGVQWELINFESDNEPANRLSEFNFVITPRKRDGIDYQYPKIVQKGFHKVVSKKTVSLDSIIIDMPEVGNYRFRVNLKEKNIVIETREVDFGIKRKNYPYIITAHDLLESLHYLLNTNEKEKFRTINNQQILLDSIKSFFNKEIKDTTKVNQVIREYISRVETANKLFSTYKEGWKTDMGMVYILFGAPLWANETYDYIHWSYKNDRYDPRWNYYFRQIRRKSDVFPFRVYILDRSNPQFRYNEYLAIKEWLNGNVLNPKN